MRACALTAAVLLLVGCVTGRPKDAEPPVFAIHYYPYTVSLVRTIAKPLPDYREWTMKRREQDIQRLGDLGVDLVIVSIDPVELRDPGRISQYLEFFKQVQYSPMKAALMVEAHKTPEARLHWFMRWCANTLPGHPGYYHDNGKPLVVLYDALGDENCTNEALSIRHTVWGKQWYWGVNREDKPELSRNGEQAMAFAGFLRDGDNPQRGFSLSRDNGSRIKRQVSGALKTGAKFICIASYNDFWEGHFVEPNTFDGSYAYDALQQEIRSAKRRYGEPDL